MEYRVSVPAELKDPNAIQIQDLQNDPTKPLIQVLTGTNLIYYGGDNLTGAYIPGVYTVEVRAWGYNNYDTGEFEELQITIVDPCQAAAIRAVPFTPEKQSHTFGSSALTFGHADFILEVGPDFLAFCGKIEYHATFDGEEVTPLTEPLAYDTDTQTFELNS